MEKAIVLYKMAKSRNQISKSQSKSKVGLLKGRFNCKAKSTIQVLVSINIIYSDIQDSLFAKILYHSVDSCFRNFAFTTMAKAVSCWKRIISPKTNNNSFKRTSATTDHERVLVPHQTYYLIIMENGAMNTNVFLVVCCGFSVHSKESQQGVF